MYIILILAVVNLSAGYALGVFWGRGFDHSALFAGAVDFVVDTFASLRERISFSRQAKEPEIAAVAAPISPPAPEPVKVDPPKPDISPAFDVAEILEPPAEQETSTVTVDDCVAAFKAELERYRDELAGIDDRVRECAGVPDREVVEHCIADFRHANGHYLQQQATMAGTLQKYEATYGRENPEFHQALAQQAAQIEMVNTRLEELQSETDLPAACDGLRNHTETLANAAFAVRDLTEELSIDLEQQSPGAKRNPAGSDWVPGIASLSDLRSTLREWWDKGSVHTRPLTMAVIDTDRLQSINQQFGTNVGDRILKAVAQIVVSSIGENDIAARFQGQKLLVMMPDNDARAATNLIERIRQRIERTSFQRDGASVQVTVSCGVADAANHDSPDGVTERADTALQEAKRYGRNRTFFQEGDFPAPAIPPNFSIENSVLAV